MRDYKGRGMAQRSLDLIEAMRDIAEAAQPITGRGVGYKLFTKGLIAIDGAQRHGAGLSAAADRARAGHHSVGLDRRRDPRIRAGRRHGTTRSNTPAASPAPIAATSGTSSRSASRCGARRAPCAACSQPVLDHLRRRLPGDARLLQRHRRPRHREDDDGRPLIALYVGDFDPSGMFMSEEDLPKRLAKYGGDHITVQAHRAHAAAGARPAVVPGRRQEATTRAASGSSPTTAHAAGSWTRWTRTICAIASSRRSGSLIEPVAWQRCEVVNKAEQESLQTVLEQWGGAP